jgi:hypothetical protein
MCVCLDLWGAGGGEDALVGLDVRKFDLGPDIIKFSRVDWIQQKDPNLMGLQVFCLGLHSKCVI